MIPENISEILDQEGSWSDTSQEPIIITIERLEDRPNKVIRYQVEFEGDDRLNGLKWEEKIRSLIKKDDKVLESQIFGNSTTKSCVLWIIERDKFELFVRMVKTIIDRDRKSYIFFNELTWLNVNLYIIEKWKAFPWTRLRVYVQYQTFADSVFKNYFENSIMMIRRLYYETNTDFMSLRNLRNEILRENNESKRELILAKLKPLEQKLEAFAKRVNNVRNLKLAHLSPKILGDAYKNYNLSLANLKTIASCLDKYYNVLADIGWDVQTTVLITWDYHEEYGDKVTDIDQILDKIALSSELLTVREDNPDMWEAYERQFASENSREEMLKLINGYRTRLLNLEPIE